MRKDQQKKKAEKSKHLFAVTARKFGNMVMVFSIYNIMHISQSYGGLQFVCGVKLISTLSVNILILPT